MFLFSIYRFGKMVACFRYAPISVHSVLLPPHKLDFGHHPLDWIKKEANEVCGIIKSVAFISIKIADNI
jgi:hypothetical protein